MTQDPAQLLAQANKAYSSVGSGWSSIFSSNTDKFENAAELYRKAGSAYKVRKAGREAGMAYEKAATIQGTKLNEPNDMANTLQDAFRCYRDSCPEDAARCLSQAIDHYLDNSNFRRAATQKQELAYLYEEIGDKSNARLAFETAAGWYEGDGAPALANKLNVKAAELAASDSDYLDATRLFEHAARQSVKSGGAMQFSVKKYLLQAGICHLALDVIGAKRALESYREIDAQFPSTEEGKLLAGLLEPVEQGDSEAFEGRLHQHYHNKTLDPWYLDIYMKIKGQLQLKEEDFS